VGIADGCLRVRLAAPAREGKANDALAGLLAGVLGVRRKDVMLVAGASGRRKLVRVRGIDLTAARQKLGF